MNKYQIISVVIGIILILSSSFFVVLHQIHKEPSVGIHSITTTLVNNMNPTPNITIPKIIQSIPENTKGYFGNTIMFEGNPQHIYFLPVTTGYFLINVSGAIIVPPSIYNNLLFVTTSGPMNMSSRSLPYNIGCVYAINITDGEIVWNERFPNQIMTQPIIVNGILVVGLGNNQFINSTVRGTGTNMIVALNASNGKVLWNYTTLGEDMPTPVYYKGMIIEANGNGEVFALNLTNGKLIWNDYIGSYVSMSSPLLVNNVIYFGSAHPYIFWAVSAENGKILWYDNFSENFSSLGGLDDSSPAYANGIVVTSLAIHFQNNTMEEALVAMNAFSGKVIWWLNEGIAPLPPNLESPPPVIYHGIVFHDSPVGVLYAVNLTDGKVLWNFTTGFTTSNVDIVKGRVLIQNQQGILFVLSIEGKLIKKILTPVMPGPGNILVTLNSVILVGVNGVIDSIPIQSIMY
ncbi:PQQ-binding-like beta-propeller repeat protein [Sulfurisphaera ohwakuensis]|uniref:outer membrane protein assembly factor BamB family protein n=1 Tax=Sulfurisphaera ohwakuensis TaxID=69656 RepID=UPI0036F25D7F